MLNHHNLRHTRVGGHEKRLAVLQVQKHSRLNETSTTARDCNPSSSSLPHILQLPLPRLLLGRQFRDNYSWTAAQIGPHHL